MGLFGKKKSTAPIAENAADNQGFDVLDPGISQGLAVNEELIAVITAAIKAYGTRDVHPLIRNIGGSEKVSSGVPAVNPMVRSI